MIKTQPPYFLFENESIQNVFHSINSLEKYIEPIDWDNNEYQVFDFDGRKIHFFIERLIRKGLFGNYVLENVKYEKFLLGYENEFINLIKHSYDNIRQQAHCINLDGGDVANIDAIKWYLCDCFMDKNGY